MLSEREIFQSSLCLPQHSLHLARDIRHSPPRHWPNRPRRFRVHQNPGGVPLMFGRVQSEADDRTYESIGPIGTEGQPEAALPQLGQRPASYRVEISMDAAISQHLRAEHLRRPAHRGNAGRGEWMCVRIQSSAYQSQRCWHHAGIPVDEVRDVRSWPYLGDVLIPGVSLVRERDVPDAQDLLRESTRPEGLSESCGGLREGSIAVDEDIDHGGRVRRRIDHGADRAGEGVDLFPRREDRDRPDDRATCFAARSSSLGGWRQGYGRSPYRALRLQASALCLPQCSSCVRRGNGRSHTGAVIRNEP